MELKSINKHNQCSAFHKWKRQTKTHHIQLKDEIQNKKQISRSVILRRTISEHTWISENFFGCCNINKLFLCFLLLVFVLEIIRVPLHCQLPVGFYNFLLSSIPIEMKEKPFSFPNDFQWKSLAYTVILSIIRTTMRRAHAGMATAKQKHPELPLSSEEKSVCNHNERIQGFWISVSKSIRELKCSAFPIPFCSLLQIDTRCPQVSMGLPPFPGYRKPLLSRDPIFITFHTHYFNFNRPSSILSGPLLVVPPLKEGWWPEVTLAVVAPTSWTPSPMSWGIPPHYCPSGKACRALFRLAYDSCS